MTETTGSTKQLSLEELEKILIYFSTTMFEKENESEILWDIAQNCISQLGFLDCVVYLLDEKKQVLVQKAALGPKNPRTTEILNPIDIPLGTGITGAVALSGIAEIIPDTRKDKRYVIDDESRLSEIAVPIKLKNKVIGLIDSEHPEPNYFTDQHLRILTAIASICAVRLARIKAEKQIKEEQEKLLDTEKQLMKLKSEALKAQMSPHFVFNALNGIQHYIMADDKKSAIKYLSLFGKLIRYHLKNYEADTVLLNEELQMLEWYLKLQKLRYGDQFNYKWEVNLDDKSWNVNIPSLILVGIFESAVESTVVQKIGEGLLELGVEIGDRVKIVLFYHREKEDDRSHFSVNYREEIMPWKEQIKWFNQIRHNKIDEKTQLIQDDTGHFIGIKTTLSLPIL